MLKPTETFKKFQIFSKKLQKLQSFWKKLQISQGFENLFVASDLMKKNMDIIRV